MADRVEHRVHAQFGAQHDVPLTLAYRTSTVDIRLGDDVIWTLPRQLWSDAMAFPTSIDGAHIQVVDYDVIVDVWLPLPVRLLFDLSDVEAFLSATFTADPEPVDPIEFGAVMAGVL